MVKELYRSGDNTTVWVDAVYPTDSELLGLVEKYGLLESQTKDSLDVKHLPKVEKTDTTLYAVIRVYDNNAADADYNDFEKITRKLILFLKDNTIVSIHRREQVNLLEIRDGFCQRTMVSAPKIFVELFRQGILSYEDPMEKINNEVVNIEKQVFSGKPPTEILKSLYNYKRKVDLYSRMLLLMREVAKDVTNEKLLIHSEAEELYETAVRLYMECEQLKDKITQLFNIHFNISSQKTNEIIRVLTIFSVFFMPLTFIVGVYGMNFEHMPELKNPNGYFYTWLGMIGLTIAIFSFFKYKKWI